MSKTKDEPPRDTMVVLRRRPELQQVTTWGKLAPALGAHRAEIGEALLTGKIAGTPTGPFTVEVVTGTLIPTRVYANDLRNIAAGDLVPEAIPHDAELADATVIEVEAPGALDFERKTDVEIAEGMEVREVHVVLTFRWRP